jgi:hypothetical protein
MILANVRISRTATCTVPICYVRFTSIWDVESAATNARSGEGFQTPAPLRTVVRGGGRRLKASQGGNRGEVGGWLGGCELWGFEACRALAFVAWAGVGSQVRRARRRRRACSVGKMRGSGAFARVGGGPANWRGHRCPAPARGRGRRGTALQGGMLGDGHEVSILIRLADEGRAGRAPSKVSTMIIRPPQHGQRRAGETSSA